jgi:hypothetical protein
MRTLIAIVCMLLSCSVTQGSLYDYPEDKRPAVSLNEACTIGKTVLERLGLEKDAYVYEVTILGDEGQTGAGAWTLHYRNPQGDKIQISIYFPEDFCIVTLTSKAGEHSEKGYTRDGRISPKWVEWQAKLRKDEEDAEKAFGPADPTN